MLDKEKVARAISPTAWEVQSGHEPSLDERTIRAIRAVIEGLMKPSDYALSELATEVNLTMYKRTLRAELRRLGLDKEGT